MSRPTLKTSVRSRPFAQTLNRAAALMPAFGISRVTEITRMDRLGLPVCASVRPRGLTRCVHSGKGLGWGDARVGAMMEAIEVAVAESAAAMPPDVRLSVAELGTQFGPDFHLDDLAPRIDVTMAAGRVLPAVRCDDLSRGGQVLMPSELVFLAAPGSDEANLFDSNADGLASGNSLPEATLHALLEVLERDAVAMNCISDRSCRVDLSTLPEPFVDWAGSWQAMGIELIVRQVPNTLDIPCFQAFLLEPGAGHVDLATGSALHMNRDIALARALCGAAESRLCHIPGGRNDIVRFHDALTADQRVDSRQGVSKRAAADRLLDAVTDSRCGVAYHDVVQGMNLRTSPEGLLSTLLHCLSDAGLTRVLRRCMDTPDHLLERAGLHVVRVIVPRRAPITTGGTCRWPPWPALAALHG